MKIVNLTQHKASSPQLEAGVFEVFGEDLAAKVKDLITFSSLPTPAEMNERAESLAGICKELGANFAMVGGAPFFQSTLERILLDKGITPCHAFTLRESVEVDGIKKSKFSHKGFVFNGPGMTEVQ